MPYKDKEQKHRQMKRWRADVMSRGYGKWLYARRKLRFDDATEFRKALEDIADPKTDPSGMRTIARSALDASARRYALVGEPPVTKRHAPNIPDNSLLAVVEGLKKS